MQQSLREVPWRQVPRIMRESMVLVGAILAILGVSRSSMKPVFENGAFVPRLMLPLSLSYDHRVIDGVAAARFTTFLNQILADAKRLSL